jgi:DNA-binding response OmpR family regulator
LLLDWNLPRLNGVEVLKRIRHGDRASLPILIVSKRCREDDIVSALRQGADDYLVKPVHQRELLARLEARSVLDRNSSRSRRGVATT